MSLTKDEVSDLKSLQERAKECAIAVRDATLSKQQADNALESWLYLHTEKETPR